PRPTMPTLTFSFAPHTRTADAAVRAPRKNLRVFGSDTTRLLFGVIISRRTESTVCYARSIYVGLQRPAQCDRLPGLCLKFLLLAAVTSLKRFRLAGRDPPLPNFPSGPPNRHVDPAPRSQPRPLAARERRGQGREQVDESRLARLHRRDAGRRTVRVVA